MTERPILFSSQLVRAILAGTKTQTRRVIKRENEPHPGFTWAECLCRDIDPSDTPCEMCVGRFGVKCDAGDMLWVKESHSFVDELFWGVSREDPTTVAYRADQEVREFGNGGSVVLDSRNLNWERVKYRPGIHMFRWSSRLSLRVRSVRAERLQSITVDDIAAEGLSSKQTTRLAYVNDMHEQWVALWDSINAKPKAVGGKSPTHYVSYPWEDVQETREHRGLPWHVRGNPHVWVIDFERVADSEIVT